MSPVVQYLIDKACILRAMQHERKLSYETSQERITRILALSRAGSIVYAQEDIDDASEGASVVSKVLKTRAHGLPQLSADRLASQRHPVVQHSDGTYTGKFGGINVVHSGFLTNKQLDMEPQEYKMLRIQEALDIPPRRFITLNEAKKKAKAFEDAGDPRFRNMFRGVSRLGNEFDDKRIVGMQGLIQKFMPVNANKNAKAIVDNLHTQDTLAGVHRHLKFIHHLIPDAIDKGLDDFNVEDKLKFDKKPRATIESLSKWGGSPAMGEYDDRYPEVRFVGDPPGRDKHSLLGIS